MGLQNLVMLGRLSTRRDNLIRCRVPRKSKRQIGATNTLDRNSEQLKIAGRTYGLSFDLRGHEAQRADKGEPSSCASKQAKGPELCLMKTDQAVERMRIRAKLCDEDRDFLDAMKEVFPGAKLRAIQFSDGETIGNFFKEKEL